MSLRDLIRRYDRSVEMPLASGSSDATVSENIRREVHSGKPQRQAIAIAMNKAGRSNNKKKKKKPSFDWNA